MQTSGYWMIERCSLAIEYPMLRGPYAFVEPSGGELVVSARHPVN